MSLNAAAVCWVKLRVSPSCSCCLGAQIRLTERAAGGVAAVVGAAGGRQACLSLVDLAGSERAARTGNQGDRLKCVWWWWGGRHVALLLPVRACVV